MKAVTVLLCLVIFAVCPGVRADGTRDAAEGGSVPAAIEHALSAFPAIESGQVNVAILSGKAILSGNVSTLLAKEQIAAAVAGMEGIHFVQNDIRIFAGNRRLWKTHK
jgi:osmotically-inducible protein OsmY